MGGDGLVSIGLPGEALVSLNTLPACVPLRFMVPDPYRLPILVSFRPDPFVVDMLLGDAKATIETLLGEVKAHYSRN